MAYTVPEAFTVGQQPPAATMNKLVTAIMELQTDISALIGQGWQTLALASGFTGSAEWRATATDVEVLFDISGSITSDTPVTGALASNYWPTAGPGIVVAGAYIDPADTRATAVVYFSGANGTLRATSGSASVVTRIRGRARWMRD